MKAARYHRVAQGYALKFEDDVPAPIAAENEVRVRVAYCGICGSDLARYRQISDPPAGLQNLFGNLSFIPGHEFSGIIDRIGPTLEALWEDQSPVVGSRVAVHPLIGCGECAACRTSQWNRCQYPARSQVIGVHRDGGFAEWVTVPADHVIRIGDGVSLQAAALAEPLGVALHATKSVHTANYETPVVVIGDGPIGLLIAHVLKRRGHQEVRVLGRHTGRLELALQMGADVAQKLPEGRPLPDNQVECVYQVAGSQAAINAGLDLLSINGQMICLGYLHATSEGLGPAEFNDLIRSGKCVRGSFGSSRAEFESAIRGLASGEYDVSPLIDATISLDSLVEHGFEMLLQEPRPAGKILVRPE